MIRPYLLRATLSLATLAFLPAIPIVAQSNSESTMPAKRQQCQSSAQSVAGGLARAGNDVVISIRECSISGPLALIRQWQHFPQSREDVRLLLAATWGFSDRSI